MGWLGFLAENIVVNCLLWVGAYYGYSEVLRGQIVPLGTLTVEEWIYWYQMAGFICVGTVFVTSCLWFLRGKTYSGKGSVASVYYILFAVCLVVGIAAGKFVFAPFVEGGELTLFIAAVTTPLAYYLISLFGSAEAVKYVPPLSGLIH